MSQGTPRSVNRGHLTPVFSGQVTSALTPPPVRVPWAALRPQVPLFGIGHPADPDRRQAKHLEMLAELAARPVLIDRRI